MTKNIGKLVIVLFTLLQIIQCSSQTPKKEEDVGSGCNCSPKFETLQKSASIRMEPRQSQSIVQSPEVITKNVQDKPSDRIGPRIRRSTTPLIGLMRVETLTQVGVESLKVFVNGGSPTPDLKSGRKRRSPIWFLSSIRDRLLPSTTAEPYKFTIYGLPTTTTTERPSTTTTTEPPERIYTKSQENFELINGNYSEAVQFQRLMGIKDPSLKDTIVVKEKGVTCSDVCPRDVLKESTGTLGLCTRSYCRCNNIGTSDDDTVNQQIDNDSREMKCPRDLIFDPLQMTCEHPQNTRLCSDDPVTPPPHILLKENIVILQPVFFAVIPHQGQGQPYIMTQTVRMTSGDSGLF